MLQNIILLLPLQPLKKNLKTILSSQAVPKQADDQIWPTAHSVSTPGSEWQGKESGSSARKVTFELRLEWGSGTGHAKRGGRTIPGTRRSGAEAFKKEGALCSRNVKTVEEANLQRASCLRWVLPCIQGPAQITPPFDYVFYYKIISM